MLTIFEKKRKYWKQANNLLSRNDL